MHQITNQEPQVPRTNQLTQQLPPLSPLFPPPLVHLPNISSGQNKVHYKRKSEAGRDDCCCSGVNPSSSFGLVASEVNGPEESSEGEEEEGIKCRPTEEKGERDEGEVVGLCWS